MSAPTPAEQHAYTSMQARLIALLLRHDERGFQRFFGQWSDFEQEQESDAVRRYRELGVLFHLRDELFEHILPRIVRRLSFESPRSIVIEEPPARGRVDWERTLDATWTERPGETPLLLHTRQRRRDFATPGNLLTVVTLLEYHDDVQRLLWHERVAVGSEALRHPLNEIVERCERELAFPQFAGLCQVARRIIEGDQDGPEALEARVQESLIPGSNNAYEELLTWRQRRRALRLLRREPVSEPVDVLGADPQRDNYLYQLWIFFELADLLRERGCLDHLDTRAGQMHIQFRWDDGSAPTRYELRHDQAVSPPVVRWTSSKDKGAVPGVRPDFYLRRIEPPPEQVRHNGILFWREPGVVWDAKYYRESERADAPSSPVKRMIADLNLLGETHGTLLFAFLKEPTSSVEADIQDSEPMEDAATAGPGGYELWPLPGLDQTIAPEQRVMIRQMRPGSDSSPGTIQAILSALLEATHTRLRQPRVPACHGVFLDMLSVSGRTALVDRYGHRLDDDPAELLLCPKPHIGPWRMDLVSRQRHCCQDGAFCQIIGRPGATKPVRPPRTAEDLLKELQHVFARPDNLDDESVSAIARQVEGITKRFAELAGAYRRIDVYYNRLRDLGMEQTLDLLGPTERESLALAIFLVEQLDSIGAQDYSAPAIHLSSVMEVEVQRRVFQCPGLISSAAYPKNQTLGTLPFMRRKPEETEGDWDRIAAYTSRHWNGTIDPDGLEQEMSFDMFVKALDHISQLRNKAAHTHPVSRGDYSTLLRITCQSGPLRIGALNVLLLAWQ